MSENNIGVSKSSGVPVMVVPGRSVRSVVSKSSSVPVPVVPGMSVRSVCIECRGFDALELIVVQELIEETECRGVCMLGALG